MRAPPFDVGWVSGEVRREDEDSVAGVKNRLTEKLFKCLGTRPHHAVLRADLDAEFLAIIPRNCFTELRQTERRAVMRRPIFDGIYAGSPCALRTGKRAVADLQFNDIFACR